MSSPQGRQPATPATPDSATSSKNASTTGPQGTIARSFLPHLAGTVRSSPAETAAASHFSVPAGGRLGGRSGGGRLLDWYRRRLVGGDRFGLVGIEHGRLVEGQLAGEHQRRAGLVELAGPGADDDGRDGVAGEVG